MHLIDSLVGLRSVRFFKQKEIPEDVLKTILEAGRHAPSRRNIQPWHFVVVSNPETRKKLAKGKAKFIEDSALVIVGCGDPEESRRWCELEVAIAMQTMVIAAWVQGIGSCWVDIENTEEQVKDVLGIPKKLEVVALVAFGYPARAKTPKPSWKKTLDQTIHYDKF
ncbi:MAG: nitroreductase family protein [Candidatus Bathyarchaeota archaeon]|nr:MAG: nitroreductase family protein [Candidatus Bathyarchaeota archaeon]